MTLRAKLITFWAVLIVVLVGMFIVMAKDFYELADLPAQRKALALKTMNALTEARAACGSASADVDSPVLKELFDKLGSDPDFAAAYVSDENGELLASAGQAAVLLKRTNLLVVGEAVEIEDQWVAGTAELNLEGSAFGSIGVAYSFERVRAARRQAVSSFTILLLAAMVALAASVMYSTRVTAPLRAMTRVATRVAEGDLSAQLSLPPPRGDEIGAMRSAFLRMIENLRELLFQLSRTASQVDIASARILETSRNQEAGALQQCSSTVETRRTMESLLQAGSSIGTVSGVVLRNAEMTLHNSRKVEEGIETLSRHTDRITEILELIKDIANKSDLLALYAALEGVRTGEAGEGFSRVGEQMQGLADSVMGSIRDIRTLTDDIRHANTAAVYATNEAIQLAAETTVSARQINQVIQEQNAATHQATQAMDIVASVAHETAAGGKATVDATAEFVTLSKRLLATVSQFRQ